MKHGNKSPCEDGWIRTTNKLPEKRDWYLGIFQEPDTGYILEIPKICDYVGIVASATTDEGWRIMGYTDTYKPYEYYKKLHCVAWHKLPEPYKPYITEENMSGGRLNYFYGVLEEHANDLGDIELNDLVMDLSRLFHDREWYLSGDTCEGTWNEAADQFKKKWFTEVGRKERVEKYLDDVKEKVMASLGLSSRYCKNCRHWSAEDDPESSYGNCDLRSCCLMHRMENCERYESADPTSEPCRSSLGNG